MFSFQRKKYSIYQGHLCETPINPCANNPCQHNGLCSQTSTGYQCQCSSSYTGSLCEIPLNPCDYSPCKNGGQCTLLGNLSFQCICQTGIFIYKTKRKRQEILKFFKVIRVNFVIIK